MNLYAITSDNQTTFVQAGSIYEALMRWNTHMDLCNEEPDSITLAADEDDVVLSMDHDEVVNNLRIELGHARTERNNRTGDLDKSQTCVSTLLALRLDIRKLLGVTEDGRPSDVDEKIMAELVTLKAQAKSYQIYIEAKAGKATENAVKMASLQHRVSTLEQEVKIANDKLDAKEGVDCP
jgi:hypothetical protein